MFLLLLILVVYIHELSRLNGGKAQHEQKQVAAKGASLLFRTVLSLLLLLYY